MNIILLGNIGCGKTTVLQQLGQKQTGYTVVTEKVFDTEKHIDLNSIYNKQIYYALQFLQRQILYFGVKTIEERCQLEVLIVFSKLALHEGLLNKRQFETLRSIFDLGYQKRPVEHLIYLRASPSTCLDNIYKRGRISEKEVRINLIEKLHSYYENLVELIPGMEVVEYSEGRNLGNVEKAIERIEKKPGIQPGSLFNDRI